MLLPFGWVVYLLFLTFDLAKLQVTSFDTSPWSKVMAAANCFFLIWIIEHFRNPLYKVLQRDSSIKQKSQNLEASHQNSSKVSEGMFILKTSESGLAQTRHGLREQHFKSLNLLFIVSIQPVSKWSIFTCRHWRLMHKLLLWNSVISNIGSTSV